MPRRYLDNAGLFDPVSPFDMYDLAGTYTYSSPDEVVRTDSTTTTATRTVTRPRRTTKKRRNNTGSNIIRNHDTVWDYKIQNGRLLTRRKTSDGNWIDITNNNEARQRIEQFTGRTIGNKQSASNNSAQSSKPASTTKPSNNSQSQPSKPASTAQTQQTARPAATQPTRQQAARQDSTRQQTTPQRPIARQDSTRRDTTVASQPRSLARTPASNVEPDWQNMSDAEVQAYFANSPLGGVTKTGRGNSNKKTQLITDEDLAANGWHWSVAPTKAPEGSPYPYDFDLPLHYGDSDAERDPRLAAKQNVYSDAITRGRQGERILLDSNDDPVSKADVNKYINRGRIPLYLSDYDAQFYQPQSENGTLRDVRRAQDIRRNRDFDRQRNIGLAAMVGAPVLAGSVATAPAATLLGLAGSELAGAGFGGTWQHATGRSWEESLAGQDATGQFYAGMLQPGRIIGSIMGAGVANATAPQRQAVSEAISNGYNRIVGNGEMPSLIGLLRREIGNSNIAQDLLGAVKPKSSNVSKSLAETSGIPVEEYPTATAVGVKPHKKINLEQPWGEEEIAAFEREQAKAFWEHQQPYKVKGLKIMEVTTKNGGSRKVYVPKLSNKLRPGATGWGHYRFRDVPFTERLKHPIASLPHRRLNRGLLNSITGLAKFPIQYGRPNTQQELAMLLKQINRAWGQEYPPESFYSIPYIE